jgi:lysine 2,3-aminomutase
VFLKDINDDAAVLERLFLTLYRIGAIPYYIYRCDRVAGLERFVCDIHRERSILTELHRRLSGIALPRYVADVSGRGKLPLPLLFWDIPDVTRCVDFDGRDTVIT